MVIVVMEGRGGTVQASEGGVTCWPMGASWLPLRVLSDGARANRECS